ncbi:hypothetical protein HAX54_047592, partial [Datura stramonium]|nr:hypothetical protein [Datura stramonium]
CKPEYMSNGCQISDPPAERQPEWRTTSQALVVNDSWIEIGDSPLCASESLLPQFIVFHRRVSGGPWIPSCCSL